jgi:hypothetical protein
MSLTLIVVVKTLVDVALLALLSQGLLYVLAGAARERNFVYRLFAMVTAPVFALVRLVTPGFVGAQYHWLIAFFLVFWSWIGLIIAKCWVCVTTVGQCERACYLLLALLGYVPK